MGKSVFFFYSDSCSWCGRIQHLAPSGPTSFCPSDPGCFPLYKFDSKPRNHGLHSLRDNLCCVCTVSQLPGLPWLLRSHTSKFPLKCSPFHVVKIQEKKGLLTSYIVFIVPLVIFLLVACAGVAFLVHLYCYYYHFHFYREY